MLVLVLVFVGVVVVVGGVGDAGNGGLKCIIIFNFHELRCKHKTKIYRFSKIKQLM